MTLNSLLYYRSRLDEHDQKIYDDLFQHWMRLEDNFSIKKPHCSISELTQSIHWDNPALFYIDYYQISYAMSRDSIRIKGGYLYTKDQIRAYLDKIEKWGAYILKKLPEVGITEKALWLHDVIIANVRYDHGNGINPHNLIGVIVDGAAVCEGISKTYKFLCDLAGIPCIYVSGTLDQTPHGWNMLWIGGGTSFVDVTNDIRKGGGYERDHFLRSTAEMKGYTWDAAMIPACNVRNTSNAFFTAQDKQSLLDIIRRNSDKQSLSISLQFGYPLSDKQIGQLANYCYIMHPPLLVRTISYSVDLQMMYIRT